MNRKDILYTQPENTLSGMGCKRMECLTCPQLVDGFVDLFLDSVDALSLCDALRDGRGAAGELLDICEGLVRGSVGGEECPYYKRALPLIEKLNILNDKQKECVILFMELSDSFLEEKSRQYEDALLKDRLEIDWLSLQYQNLKNSLGKEEAENLYRNLCEMFVAFPVMQTYRQGYYEYVARRLRPTNKQAEE